MRESGNMYFLDANEYIKGNFWNTKETIEKMIPGPCMVRVEASAIDQDLGNILSVQIGLSRGREYILASDIRAVVFQNTN